MSVSELLTALRARVQAASDGDPSGLLDARGIAEAAELRAQATAAGGVTVPIDHCLAWFHWLRYRALPAAEHGGDLQAALERFEAVYDAEPQASMPDIVRDYLSDGHSRPAQAAARILDRVTPAADRAELDQAIMLLTTATAATSPDHPKLAGYLSNLGRILQTRFERTGATGDLVEALGLWSRAAGTDTASAGVRMHAAQAAARATVRLDGPASAVVAHQVAVELLPLLAWRGISDADRRFLIEREASSLARDSTACATSAGDPGLAIQFLEQGRGVVWAQLLDTRTDLTGLERSHADLAQRLRRCRTVLDDHPRPGADTGS